MDKVSIIEGLSTNVYELPLSCKQEIAERSTLLQVEKKTLLVQEGQYSESMFLVADGALRAYYLKDGKDVTDWFAFEHEIVSSLQSYFNNIPSPTYIESIVPSLVLVLLRNDILYFSEKYRAFERLVHIITTQTMLRLQERIVALQFETAQQKYRNLLKDKPDIELRVPLIHIASYLGITIETLSRIRGRKEKI